MSEEPIVDPSSDILKQALSSLNVIVESNTSTAGDPGISQGTQHTTLSPTPGLSADDETTTTPGTAEAAAWFLLQAGRESNARCTRSIELLSEPWLTLPPSRLYPFARSVALELVRTRAMLSMHLQDSVSVHPHRWEQRQWHRAVLRALLAVEPRAKEASLMLWQAGHAIFMRVTRRGLKARLQVEGGGWPSDDTKKDQGDKEWKWDEQSAEEEYDDLSRNCSEPKWFRELSEQFLGLRLPGDVVGKESWQLDHKIPPRETTKHIHWSSPYLACRDGFLSPGWSLTISTAFYSFSSHLIPEFRGALALELNLQDVDIDQCATNGGWFSGTHHCDRRREQCIPEKGKGFRLDAYHCICRAGFFMRKQDHLVKADATPEMPRCIPCVPGCSSCSDMTPCIVRARNELRFSLLIAQFFSLALGATLMVYRLIMHRRKKTCCPSLDLKQALLLGACLLHSLVLIHFLEPSSLLCVLSRWMRALGFVCVYGSISLRTNRLARIAFSVRHALARSTAYSFRSLCPALLLCTCLLITWTLSTVGISTQDVVLVMAENLPDGRSYAICIHDAWDYMLALMKMMALFWILWHFHTMRRHLFIFSESWCLTIASVNDLILSLAFNVIRFRLLGPTEPNIDLLLSLLHAHLSVSVTVLLALLPEFCGIWAGASDVSQQRIQTCHGQSCVCPHGSLGCSSRLDPDDVRGELRRLYARLEEKKGEKMRADNTHLTVQHTSRTVPAALRLCWASQTDHNHELLSDADIPRVQGMLKDVDRHLELQSRHPRESSDLFLECETSVENQKVKTATCLQNLNVNALEETPPKLTFVIRPDSSTPRPPRFRSLSAECLMEMHAGWHSVLKQTLSLVEGGKDGLESWDWMNKEEESLETLHGAATDVCSLNTDLARRSSTIFLNSQEMWSERDDWRVETVTEENNASTNSLCKCDSIDELNKITINQARIEASLKDIPSSPGHSAGRIDNLEELLKQTENASEMQDGEHFIISTETKTLSSFTPASRLPVEVGVDSFAIAENNVMNIKLNVDSCPCKDWHNEATSDKFMNANQHPENCPGKQNESAKHILSTQTTSEHGEETCSLPLSHRRPLRESLSKVCALDKTSSHSTVGREILFAEICPWEKIDISMTHSGEALQSEVCPWKKNDSQTAEILQSKSSSSGKAEISLAHWKTLRDSISKVCPQDKKDIAQRRHISLSEICPWENTDESAVVKIETPIPDFTPKSGEHHLSEICPWEKVCDSSNDNKDIMQAHNEQLGKTDIALAHWRKVKESLSKIDPLDNRGIFSNPSRKISLSEICPWEKIGEVPTQRKETCLSDICPWEETVISATKNANYLAESTNDPGRADISLAHCGKVRQSISKICHPENKAVLDIKGREILSQVHPREKIDDFDESSKEFLISEICPWDKTNTSSAENKNNFQSKTDLSEETDLSLGHWGKVKDSLSQICTLDKKERSDSQSRTNVLAEICPWEIIEEDETLRKEILLSESCPWENTDISASQSEDALQSENDPRKRTDASLAHWRKVRDSFLQLSSSSERAASTSQSKRTSFTEICPWENTDLPVNQSVETLQSRKTDETLANWKKVRDSISHINPLDKKNLSALQSRKTFLCEVCPWEISDESDAHNKDAEMIPCEKVVEPALVSTDTMLSKNESSGKTNLSLAHWKKVRDSLSVICSLDKSDFSVSPRRKTLLSDICPWENSDMSVFQVKETSLLENTGDIDKTNATFVNNLHTQHSSCLLETVKSDSKGTQSVEQMVIETEDIYNEEFKNNDSGRELQVKGELHDLPIDKIAINFCEAEQSHLRHCFEDAGTGSREKEDRSHDSKSMGDVESKSVVGVKSISTETQTQKARVLWTQAITSTRKLKQKSVSKENEKLDIARYQKIKVLTSGEGCGQSSTQSTEYGNASGMHRVKPIQSPGHDGSIPRLDTLDLASKVSEDKVLMKGCDGSLPEAHSYSGELNKIKEQEVQCENFSCDIGTQDMNTGEIWVGKIGQDIMNGKRVNRKQTSGQIVEEIKETPSLKRGEYTRNREASGIEKGDADKAKGRRKKKMEKTEHMRNVQLSHCGTQTNVRTDHRVRGQAKAQRGMKANTCKGAEGGSSQIGVHNSRQPSTQGIVQITPYLCNRTQEPQNTVVQEVMKQEGNTKECIETCTIVGGETSPISTKRGCKQGLLKQTHRRLGLCTTISIDKLYTGLNTNSPETETTTQPPEHHGKHVAE